MKEELSEKEMQELEELYGHNREENNLQARELKNNREKFYKWGALFFQIMTILLSIGISIWIITLIVGLMSSSSIN